MGVVDQRDVVIPSQFQGDCGGGEIALEVNHVNFSALKLALCDLISTLHVEHGGVFTIRRDFARGQHDGFIAELSLGTLRRKDGDLDPHALQILALQSN